jgi:hypothetical protein
MPSSTALFFKYADKNQMEQSKQSINDFLLKAEEAIRNKDNPLKH